MADSKINQQNEKESTVAAAAISSPAGTKFSHHQTINQDPYH